MGSLRKLNGSKFWSIRYYKNGRQFTESTRTANRKDAQKILKLREADLAKGIPVAKKGTKLRFDDGIKDVLNHYRVKGFRSAAKVEQRVRLHLSPYFGGMRMTDIGTRTIRAYQAHRTEQGAAPATINRECSILNKAFVLAVTSRDLAWRPVIEKLTEAAPKTDHFTDAEFVAFRDNMPTILQGLMTFLRACGWRSKSEVQTLVWGQVDRKAQVIRLSPEQSKNKEGRPLPYGAWPELVEVIETQWQYRKEIATQKGELPAPENDWLFHRNGKQIKDFRGAFKSALKNAGIPEHKTPHSLRRTCVRNLHLAKVDPKKGMRLTGHKTFTVYEDYNTLVEGDVADVLAEVAAFQNG